MCLFKVNMFQMLIRFLLGAILNLLCHTISSNDIHLFLVSVLKTNSCLTELFRKAVGSKWFLRGIQTTCTV